MDMNDASFDLVVDLRKYNDSGIGNYIRNCVIDVTNKISLTFKVCVLIPNEVNSDLPNILSKKILAIKLKSRPLTPLEQFEFLFKVPRSKYFWCTSLSMPLMRRGSLITTIYDVSYLYVNNSSLKIIFKKIITWIFLRYSAHKSAAILFISKFSRSEFLKYFSRVIGDSVLLKEIPLGVGVEWKPNSKKISSAKPYFIIIGNIRPHKNMKFVIEAMSKLELVNKFNLHIVGDFDGQRLKDIDLMSYLNRLSWVTYLGKLDKDRLIEEVNNSSILIAPSLYEGFGLTVLEGMASGIAVLASDIPAHREVGGNSIMFFNPRSSIDFVNKLEKLIDPKINANFREMGLKRSTYFTWQETIKETYSQVLLVLEK
jgi:glycosyltransferase involved in cell wall biosynthesis